MKAGQKHKENNFEKKYKSFEMEGHLNFTFESLYKIIY